MPLSRDDVRYGYVYLLGRHPESGHVIDQYCQQFDDVKSFRSHLMKSAEYQIKHRTASVKSFTAHTPPADIDTVMDLATLQAVVSKTASYWSKIGTDAPHWSVLSLDKFAREGSPKTLTSFTPVGWVI